MYRAVLLICALLALVKGNSTPVSRCTSNGGDLPINAYIRGCTVTPCPLARGTDAVIDMVFRAPYFIRRMKTYATAHLILTIDYELGDEAETCNFLTNSYCPVLKNEILQYTLRMRIENAFPMITVTIEFRIEDDNDNTIVCIRLPVRVTAAGTMNNALNGTVVGDI